MERESAADSNSINEKETITMNPMGDVPTQQPSNTYLTLQVDQCSSDAVYEETSTLGITKAEHEMEQMTSDEIYDNVVRNQEESIDLIQLPTSTHSNYQTQVHEMN